MVLPEDAQLLRRRADPTHHGRATPRSLPEASWQGALRSDKAASASSDDVPSSVDEGDPPQISSER